MFVMLAVLGCTIGIFGLLVIAELLGKHRVLKGEYHRKFLHITSISFIAFWPWLISWRTIQIIGLTMALVEICNRYLNFLNYEGRIGRATYGEIFFALGVFLAATMTRNKIFFELAILQVALADGFAAVAGIAYGKNWRYKVFGHRKTLVGSMVFWIISLSIFAVGLLPAYQYFSIHEYYLILFLVPPLLTLIENVSILGLDNMMLPLATIILLKLVQA